MKIETKDGKIIAEAETLAEAKTLLKFRTGNTAPTSETKPARAKRKFRKKTIKHYDRWTKDEERKVIKLHLDGVSPKEIGRILNRNNTSISSKLWELKNRKAGEGPRLFKADLLVDVFTGEVIDFKET